MPQPTNDLYVAGVGAGFARVGKGEKPKLGDLIESARDGTARVQKGDIIRSSTIGKITSLDPKIVHPDGSRVLPCVLMCG